MGDPERNPQKDQYRLRITNEDVETHNVRITIEEGESTENRERIFEEVRVLNGEGGTIDLSKHLSASNQYTVNVAIGDGVTTRITVAPEHRIHAKIISEQKIKTITRYTD